MLFGEVTDLKLRPAGTEDVERLFAWRNHPDVRAVSRSGDPLDFGSHERWYASATRDPNILIWIGLDERGNPVGMVRAQRESEGCASAELSIVVDPARQGQGFGGSLIILAEGEIRRSWPSVRMIEAEVLSHNPGSLRLFERVGFVQRSTWLTKEIGQG